MGGAQEHFLGKQGWNLRGNAYMQLKLMKDVMGKDTFAAKQETDKNLGQLLNAAGDFVTQHTGIHFICFYWHGLLSGIPEFHVK